MRSPYVEFIYVYIVFVKYSFKWSQFDTLYVNSFYLSEILCMSFFNFAHSAPPLKNPQKSYFWKSSQLIVFRHKLADPTIAFTQ